MHAGTAGPPLGAGGFDAMSLQQCTMQGGPEQSPAPSPQRPSLTAEARQQSQKAQRKSLAIAAQAQERRASKPVQDLPPGFGGADSRLSKGPRNIDLPPGFGGDAGGDAQSGSSVTARLSTGHDMSDLERSITLSRAAQAKLRKESMMAGDAMSDLTSGKERPERARGMKKAASGKLKAATAISSGAATKEEEE